MAYHYIHMEKGIEKRNEHFRTFAFQEYINKILNNLKSVLETLKLKREKCCHKFHTVWY